MRRTVFLLALAASLALAGCRDGGVETRTFELRHLPPNEAVAILDPYVYSDRERNPGRLSVTEAAVTVRETPDNLDRIARVLAEYDRPRPGLMLHFQIIAADGPAREDPAIEAITRELRRLFRFDGYRLLAETRVAGTQGAPTRQTVGSGTGRQGQFVIRTEVAEVRLAGDAPTVTMNVSLSELEGGVALLNTRVTIPVGHSAVLGTAQSPGAGPGALILVVRAEVMETAAD